MDQTSETNLINNLQKEVIDKTMILVTHKLNILSLANRVIVMNRSKIILDGSKDEVVKKLQGGQ
jgi:ATP-binding cassette subfamily C protein LapB